MKAFFSYVLEAVKMCLNVLMGAFCFIKIDHDVAEIPNAAGEIVQYRYDYSIYDKLLREGLQIFVYLALAVMAASVALSVLSCVIRDGRKLKIASHVVFALSAVCFLALLFYSMQIQYGY